VDKSPGQDAVRLAPLLAHVFPRAQFVFAYRNPIATVSSGMRMWPDRPDGFRELCGAWVKTMRLWRKMKPLLRGRYVEIAQERMAAEPLATAENLAAFLRIPECAAQMGKLMATHRANSAYPDREPGDYSVDVRWSEDERWLFSGLCGEEMSVWGYAMDLDDPAGPGRPTAPAAAEGFADEMEYFAWLAGPGAEARRSVAGDARESAAGHGPRATAGAAGPRAPTLPHRARAWLRRNVLGR
jgi:hypothetical protein